MTRDRNGLIVFAALMLAGVLVLLAVTTSRSLTAQSWQPYRGGFEPVAGATYGPVPLYLPSPTTTAVVAPSLRPTEPRSAPPTPKPTQRPTGRIVAPSVAFRGVATWQPLPGLYASLGPKLREAGVVAGQRLTVCSGGRCVVVTAWPGGCWCRERPGGPTLLDLSSLVFSRLAPLGVGVISVEVSW